MSRCRPAHPGGGAPTRAPPRMALGTQVGRFADLVAAPTRPGGRPLVQFTRGNGAGVIKSGSCGQVGELWVSRRLWEEMG